MPRALNQTLRQARKREIVGELLALISTLENQLTQERALPAKQATKLVLELYELAIKEAMYQPNRAKRTS